MALKGRLGPKASQTPNADLSRFDLEIASWGSSCRSNDAIRKATEDGLVTTKAIAARARAVLQLLDRTGKLTEQFHAMSDATEIPPENREASREAEAESIVLLKNDRNILPLEKTKLKKVSLLGPLAKRSTVPDQGENQISPFDAFKEKLGDDVEISYSKGIYFRYQNSRPPTFADFDRNTRWTRHQNGLATSCPLRSRSSSKRS